MALPTIDKLRAYLPYKVLTADGQALPQCTVDLGQFFYGVYSLFSAQIDGYADHYFDGAIGFFDGGALEGNFFHVKESAGSMGGFLLLAGTLPSTPQPGDTFRLFLGGRTRSAQEAFGLIVGQMLPEIEPATGNGITGLTITKASPLLGTATLYIHYDALARTLAAKIGTQSYGTPVDASGDLTNAILRTAGDAAWVQVSAVAASLPVSDATDTWAVTPPVHTFTPPVESYEPGAANVGKLRYRFEVVKNTDATDAMNAVHVYTEPQPGSATTIGAAGPLGLTAGDITAADASDWPEKNIWIKNTTRNDCRYAATRSGNDLHCAAVTWAKLAFHSGSNSLARGRKIRVELSPGVYAYAYIYDFQVVSGSQQIGTATGVVLIYQAGTNWIAGWTDSESPAIPGSWSRAFVSTSVAHGLRDHEAVNWQAGDAIEPMSDVDLLVDAPAFADPADETKHPGVLAFSHAHDSASALSLGDLAAGASCGVWRREFIVSPYEARERIASSETVYEWGVVSDPPGRTGVKLFASRTGADPRIEAASVAVCSALTQVEAMSAARAAVRQAIAAQGQSVMDAIRTPIVALSPAYAAMRQAEAAASIAVIGSRQGSQAQSLALLDGIKTPIAAQSLAVVASRQGSASSSTAHLDAIKDPIVALSLAQADCRQAVQAMSLSVIDAYMVRFAQSLAVIGSRQGSQAQSLALLDARQPDGVAMALSPARIDSMVEAGWHVYARNTATGVETLLGFVTQDANPKTIVDAPLADGVWELEARPSEFLWAECRSRRITTLIVTGGAVTSTDLPVIVDLRRESRDGVVFIRWRVVGSYALGAFAFGLWFSPTSPVGTGGAPDESVVYFVGQGDYLAVHAQTAPEYVAVAAYTDSAVGPVAELALPWGTTPLISPPDQHAAKS